MLPEKKEWFGRQGVDTKTTPWNIPKRRFQVHWRRLAIYRTTIQSRRFVKLRTWCNQVKI
jgi:hypothetical protein